MLKLFGIRTWIGLIAMLVAGGAILVMQDRLSAWWATGQVWPTLAKDHGDWRQHELVFLKQAYDRLEAQRRAFSGTAPASLRNEQQEILRRIVQTANPIRDKIPSEIAALLPDQPQADQPAARAVPEKPALQAALVAPMPTLISAPEPIEFRMGSAAFPGVDLDLSSLSRDPELDQVMERVQKIRPHPVKPPDVAAKSTTAETSGSAKQ